MLASRKTSVITISDRTCIDCGGEVIVFAVPDRVWDGLGIPLDAWICLDCLARRLNPKKPPDTVDGLNVEIIRQRKRLRLGKNNLYNGEIRFPLSLSLRIGATRDDSLRTMTAEQTGKCKRWKNRPVQ